VRRYREERELRTQREEMGYYIIAKRVVTDWYLDAVTTTCIEIVFKSRRVYDVQLGSGGAYLDQRRGRETR